MRLWLSDEEQALKGGCYLFLLPQFLASGRKPA
jgi:hypothetical protein